MFWAFIFNAGPRHVSPIHVMVYFIKSSGTSKLVSLLKCKCTSNFMHHVMYAIEQGKYK